MSNHQQETVKATAIAKQPCQDQFSVQADKELTKVQLEAIASAGLSLGN